MDGWSPAVAAAPDNERSSSEGEYILEPRPEGETRQADVGGHGGSERMDDGGTTVGFGISGIGEGKVVLGRVGHSEDKELRYLHLLWEPGRAEFGAGGAASKPGKMNRRHRRAARSLGPIGKDIYGKKGLPCLPNTDKQVELSVSEAGSVCVSGRGWGLCYYEPRGQVSIIIISNLQHANIHS